MNNGSANTTNEGSAEELLPLSPQVFHILLALSDGEERHGYGIARQVEQRTGGEVRLGPGTLYGAIKRMISQGLIIESSGPAEPSEGSGGHQERRRYYRITEAGRQTASAEAQRLEGLVSTARKQGLLGGFAGGSDAIPGEV